MISSAPILPGVGQRGNIGPEWSSTPFLQAVADRGVAEIGMCPLVYPQRLLPEPLGQQKSLCKDPITQDTVLRVE